MSDLIVLLLLFFFVIAASIVLFLYIKARKTIKVLKGDISTQQETIKGLKNELEEKSAGLPSVERIKALKEKESALNAIYKSLPNFKKVTGFQERLEALIDFIVCQLVEKIPDENERQQYMNFFNVLRQGADAYCLILLLRDKKMRPLMTCLKGLQADSVKTADYNMILEQILDAAMTTYDVVTTAFNNPNALSGQELNVKLLKNNITREDALSQAKLITDNQYETDSWAVVLKKMLASKGINRSNVICSGYKLS